MFGVLLLDEVPITGVMQEFYAIFDEVLDGAGDREARKSLQDQCQSSSNGCRRPRLLENGGCAVTRVVERHGRMRFANGTALFNHHFIKLGLLEGGRKKVVPGREEEVFLRLQNRLDEAAAQTGARSLTMSMAYIEAVAV